MAKPKDKQSLIDDITKRFRVTATEARDIVSAVRQAGYLAGEARKGGKEAVKKGTLPKVAKNVAKQVAETGRAAVTGKKGTTSGTTTSVQNGSWPYGYKEGKKRK